MWPKRVLLCFVLSLLLICAGCNKAETINSGTVVPDISAWVVDWDLDNGLKEAATVPSGFNSVQLFAAYFDEDGKLFIPENIKGLLGKGEKELKDQGLKDMYLTVVNDVFLNSGKVSQKDSKLIEGIMTDEKKRKAHIEELAGLVSDSALEGLCLDYENVPIEVWKEYAVFISELGSKLKKEGKQLRVVLEPSSPIDSVKLPAQYEYTMMAYNLYGSHTGPGPKADKRFIEGLCDKMNKNLKNVRIAFSLGGYDWPDKGDISSVTQLEAEKLLAKSGSDKKYYKDSNAVYFNYKEHNGVNHTVCYVDTKTLRYWVKTAQEKGINKFALWRLGGNNKDTLSQIRDSSPNLVPPENSNNNEQDMNEKTEKSDVISSVVTGRKVLSLTFNGLPDDEEETRKLLDELDALNIKATFFISGIKAAEEQEAVRMIVERGHELGNSTLTGVDLTLEDYNEKIRQISKSHDAIFKYAGVEPKYLRPGHGTVDDAVSLAAAECGYDKIVTYSVNPQDWNSKTPEEIASIVTDKKKRGGIIILNADKNPRVREAIPLIYQGLKAKGYEIIPLWQLVEIYEDRKENQYIPRGDVKVDADYKNTQYRIFEEGPAGKMQIALTFDDWGSDDTLDGILDVLDKFNVKATFFLRAKGVESNPSLALAISERGHEIANHTYSHTDLDQMAPLEIQEDIVKAHNVIANAINKEPARYLRPPRGVYNPESAEAAAACGYGDIIMYSTTALDWDNNKTAEDIEKQMLNNAFDGSILLLHMLDNINTTEALPAIIEGLQAKGYNLVTVGQLLNDK